MRKEAKQLEDERRVLGALFDLVLIVSSNGAVKKVVSGHLQDANVLSSVRLRPARQILLDSLNGVPVEASVTLEDGANVRIRCVPAGEDFCITLEPVHAPFSSQRRRTISTPEYEFIVGNMRQGLCRVDANGVIEYVNSYFVRWLETSRDAIIGTPLTEWMSIHADVQQDRFEAEFRTVTGIRLRALVARSPLMSPRGRVRGSVDIITDITAEHALRTRLVEEVQRMTRLARTDALTGLANRVEFEEMFDVLKLRGEAFALLLADVDNFKAVNDSQGHSAGDAALADLSRRMRACVRDSDLVARIGGDEFAILLPGATPEVAAEVADRIAKKSQEGELQVSIGRAHSENGTETLMQTADSDMYRHKRSNKNSDLPG